MLPPLVKLTTESKVYWINLTYVSYVAYPIGEETDCLIVMRTTNAITVPCDCVGPLVVALEAVAEEFTRKVTEREEE